MNEKRDLKKGRLTLTGNKMPDQVYEKLEEKGADRRLTPYIVNLVEKEEVMDKLIEGLSILVQKVDDMHLKIDGLEELLDGKRIVYREQTAVEVEEIKQGSIQIGEKITGGIEEEIEEMDF